MPDEGFSVDLTPDSEEGLSGIRVGMVPAIESAPALAAFAAAAVAGVPALLWRRGAADEATGVEESSTASD